MTKKISFLPALNTQAVFKETNSVHAVGAEFMDHRDKLKLYMPEKCYKKDIPMWNLQKTCQGDFFSLSVRQEKDVYDEDLLKYMRTLGRGIKKPDRASTATATVTDGALSYND